MTSYEQAASFVRRADGEGNSLYDHLTSVLATVLKERPDDALQRLEQISASLKREGVRSEALDEVAALPETEEARARVLRAVERTKTLVCGPPKGEDEEEDEEEEGGHVPDVLGHARLFREAGVALGEERAYELAQALGQLAKRDNVASLRLFGVVKGTEADYVVAEAKLAEAPEAPEDADEKRMEAPGQGVNEFAYFACNEPGDAWTQLPDLDPSQVKASRLVRRFFTGRLDAAVAPVFPWGEAALLRAQIARIAAATVVSPAGFYGLDEESEEGDEIVESEEYEGVGSPADVQWVHHRQSLRRDGRCKKFEKPEEDEDEDEDGAGAAEEEDEDAEEEDVAALRGLDEDEAPKQTVWVFRASSKSPHGVASAQSLVWPGAVAVAQGKAFANIYVGWGLKRLPTNFTPPGVPEVRAEFQAKRADEDEEEEEEEDEAEDGENAGEKRQKPLTLLEQTDPLPPPPEEKAEGDEEDGDGDEEDDE